MIYIFVFLGEFGYELLNWQGTVRKFAKTLNSNDRIVIASRKGLNLFYEEADIYIDISELVFFKQSIATGYGANCPDILLYSNYEKYHDKRFINGTYSIRNYRFRQKLKKQVKDYINSIIEKEYGTAVNEKIIFSDKFECINSLRFGRQHFDKYNIYDKLNIQNNEYIKLLPQLGRRQQIELALNISLEDDYILCQMGSRSIVQRSKAVVDPIDIISKLSKLRKIVLLEFSTGRNRDSGSTFDNNGGLKKYICSSFEDQSVLIAYANCCLFFTEGDFRSHNYLPPFFGKNVFSVADKSVYELPTTPIDFWNENVFRFGGSIIPIYSNRLSEKKYYTWFFNIVTGKAEYSQYYD